MLTSRAEIQVLRAEIERHLLVCGVRTLENETLAIANCLKHESREVDAYIHPFQQFAVTMYDHVDPHTHLDAVNKCGQIQNFITRLKNRGTEVETLTSGPGYVFTLKDINDCVTTLAKGVMKYAEQELRSRCEQAAKKEEWYGELLYCKDQQLAALEQRLSTQNSIIDKVVSSRMYEKGNQIVYELDQANRSLKLLKDNICNFEGKTRKEIEAQFKNKLDHREMVLFKELRKFGEFKSDMVTSVKAQFTNDQEKIKEVIRKRADELKNLEVPTPQQAKGGLKNPTKKPAGRVFQLSSNPWNRREFGSP